MIPIETIAVAKMSDLVLRAWKVGIVYFQVYESKPNPEFYRTLSDCLPYERIVEIPTADAARLKEEVAFKGKVPFFGAATGGWFIWISDDPKDAAKIVEFARRQVVLPSTEHPKRGPDEEITLEGMG